MFELNPYPKIERSNFHGTSIFKIDNFYQNPDEVFDYLFNREVPLWKIEEYPSRNRLYFEEKRLQLKDRRLYGVSVFLSNLCKQKPYNFQVTTNMARYLYDDFNSYRDSYWWPHTDAGYNALVYFNKGDGGNGTNLYLSCEDDEKQFTDSTPEHYEPWRPKNKYVRAKYLKPRYNRMYMFDGEKFLHGPAINNDRYFYKHFPGQNPNTFRCNQVFFFWPSPL